MKKYLITMSLFFLVMSIAAQQQFIATRIGKIAVYIREVSSAELPVIFLHGVYFDHHLWDRQIENITDQTTISIDMPLHGASSQNIKTDWTLNDCADMLIEILDSLHIQKVIAVGHSWGSMTILRAANKYPERFTSVVLCNMPLLGALKKQKAIFGIQHSLLIFRNFYTKQAAKSLFGKQSLIENTSLIAQLK